MTAGRAEGEPSADRGERGDVGAYGFRVRGPAEASKLLAPAQKTWPVIQIVRRAGAGVVERDELGESRARLRLQGGGDLVIDRNPMRATFTTPTDLPPDALAHPYLAPVAAIAARWLGRNAFHGGSYANTEGAWAVLGPRSSGKSSLLARLAVDGTAVLADDLVVLDGRTVYAGPRSIDLRPDAARTLGVGVPIGLVGRRERWRLELDQVETALPLRGWIFLEWGERLELRVVPPAERLVRIASLSTVRALPQDPASLLDLAALPAWELRRPPGWESLAAAAASLGALQRSPI